MDFIVPAKFTLTMTSNPLIKQYTLNYIRNPKYDLRYISLAKGFWKVWVVAEYNYQLRTTKGRLL